MDMAVHLEGRLFLSLSLGCLKDAKSVYLIKAFICRRKTLYIRHSLQFYFCDIFFLCYFLFQENINTGTHVLFGIPYLF